jgi:hypothetical protein
LVPNKGFMDAYRQVYEPRVHTEHPTQLGHALLDISFFPRVPIPSVIFDHRRLTFNPTVYRRVCPVGNARSAIGQVADGTVGSYICLRETSDGEPSAMHFSGAITKPLGDSYSRPCPVRCLFFPRVSQPVGCLLFDGTFAGRVWI